ncbi:TlpA family protein disulfide reductase [Microbispora sp. NEAU-D428]|uniref:TlpA disulfide reductase family protein n=1 Tax=Microbispora sitophila TaxID=2771537 RepID=UPI001868EBEC|nr:TlpA disulfide reductase family protein [Microbispora sitophila]MBE3011822.1 TlpA family protein disulfide reductase [Microbispora sitophila]
MAVLVAAVILLGGLVLVNLLLTTAIIRKLRTLGKASPPGGEVPAPGLAVGAEVPAFSALTVADTKVDSDGFAGERTLVGFFSTDCRHCLPKAPAFLATARDAAADGVRTLAVVVAGSEGPAKLLAALTDDVSVVVEDEGGAMADAFAISGFPVFFLVGPDATVAASGHEPERLLAASSRI